jgi:hypothetical protein
VFLATIKEDNSNILVFEITKGIIIITERIMLYLQNPAQGFIAKYL